MSQKTGQIALALALTAACGGGSSDATTAASTQGTGTTAERWVRWFPARWRKVAHGSLPGSDR